MPALKLTETQQKTLAAMREHDGELVRLTGGFWTWRDCPRVKLGVPSWYCDMNTLRALEKRGLVTLLQEALSYHTLARLTEAGKVAA